MVNLIVIVFKLLCKIHICLLQSLFFYFRGTFDWLLQHTYKIIWYLDKHIPPKLVSTMLCV